jgi:hypothetical protein
VNEMCRKSRMEQTKKHENVDLLCNLLNNVLSFVIDIGFDNCIL